MPNHGAKPYARHHAAERPTEEPGVRPAYILVAEDDRELRCLLATELRKEGYIVEEARSGFDFLELMCNSAIGDSGFDLIVTDIRMPGLTGLAVVEGIRGGMTQGISKTPVILITAFGDEDTHAQARRLGTAIFDKPFDLAAFRECAVSMVRGHPTMDPRR